MIVSKVIKRAPKYVRFYATIDRAPVEDQKKLHGILGDAMTADEDRSEHSTQHMDDSQGMFDKARYPYEDALKQAYEKSKAMKPKTYYTPPSDGVID